MDESLIDVIFAHRYLYYVLGTHAISDREYDRLEFEYENKTGISLPVGSDLESDYTSKQIKLAKRMMSEHIK